MNINKQLQILQLGPFIGRPHSGIDVGLLQFPFGLPSRVPSRIPQDARNICRVLIELARRKKPLLPTTTVNIQRRWRWMGKAGKVTEAEL